MSKHVPVLVLVLMSRIAAMHQPPAAPSTSSQKSHQAVTKHSAHGRLVCIQDHSKQEKYYALQDKDMVSALLEMKVQLDTVLNQAFQKNEQFSNALKEAFEKFINQRQNK